MEERAAEHYYFTNYVINHWSKMNIGYILLLKR